MRNGVSRESLGSALISRFLHTCLMAGSLATPLCAAPGTAAADTQADAINLGRSLEVWEKVEGRFQLRDEYSPTGCVDHLKALTEASAPTSITFELDQDTPDLPAGKHRWTEARAACAAITTAVARAQKILVFSRWADTARLELNESGGARNGAFFRNCLTTYDEAIQAGIPPTERTTGYPAVAGTMQDIREKWCVPGKAAADAAEEAHAAPYRKVLKNDKLQTALTRDCCLLLPGGAKLSPERLAAANVWFEDASPDHVCTNGLQVHVLHRYQFDAQQRLVKVTDREFCGTPPSAAFH
jgi:hypothetical protein